MKLRKFNVKYLMKWFFRLHRIEINKKEKYSLLNRNWKNQWVGKVCTPTFLVHRTGDSHIEDPEVSSLKRGHQNIHEELQRIFISLTLKKSCYASSGRTHWNRWGYQWATETNVSKRTEQVHKGDHWNRWGTFDQTSHKDSRRLLEPLRNLQSTEP